MTRLLFLTVSCRRGRQTPRIGGVDCVGLTRGRMRAYRPGRGDQRSRGLAARRARAAPRSRHPGRASWPGGTTTGSPRTSAMMWSVAAERQSPPSRQPPRGCRFRCLRSRALRVAGKHQPSTTARNRCPLSWRRPIPTKAPRAEASTKGFALRSSTERMSIRPNRGDRAQQRFSPTVWILRHAPRTMSSAQS